MSNHCFRKMVERLECHELHHHKHREAKLTSSMVKKLLRHIEHAENPLLINDEEVFLTISDRSDKTDTTYKVVLCLRNKNAYAVGTKPVIVLKVCVDGDKLTQVENFYFPSENDIHVSVYKALVGADVTVKPSTTDAIVPFYKAAFERNATSVSSSLQEYKDRVKYEMEKVDKSVKYITLLSAEDVKEAVADEVSK